MALGAGHDFRQFQPGQILDAHAERRRARLIHAHHHAVGVDDTQPARQMIDHLRDQRLALLNGVGQPLHAQKNFELGVEQVDVKRLGNEVDGAQRIGALDVG